MIIKGAKLCYMTSDLDAPMAPWDQCKENSDYDAWDWESEAKKLDEKAQENLFRSPLHFA